MFCEQFLESFFWGWGDEIVVWQIVFRRMSLQPHSYLHPRGLEYNGICLSLAQFANAWPVAGVATARELCALVARNLKW